jgi:cytochrome bd ubiquinol oxidase subunit II
MSTLTLATICAALIWFALIAYAVLGGADFGGGVWDLLARGPRAEKQRAAIASALGPVWEANNVWLIFVIVLTWTTFPIVYAAISTALFIPLTLALVGIIFRGAAFGFRSAYGRRIGVAEAWGYVFSVASVVTPFLLGMIAGAIAGGDIHIHGRQVVANYWTTWTTPFAFACGAFALGLCSVLAATYLTAEAQTNGDHQMLGIFLPRAILAGAATAVIGAIAALLARWEEPVLWEGLVGRALPLSLGAVLVGLATAATLVLGRYRLARMLVAAETALIIAAWGVAQYPYLIVPDLTLQNAASPASTLTFAIISSLLGMLILLPSLWYLFVIFKIPTGARPKETAASFALSLQRQEDHGAAKPEVESGETNDQGGPEPQARQQ